MLYEVITVVDVDAGAGLVDLALVDAHHDAAGVDALDDAVVTHHHRASRVIGHGALHAGPDQRGVGAQQRSYNFV